MGNFRSMSQEEPLDPMAIHEEEMAKTYRSRTGRRCSLPVQTMATLCKNVKEIELPQDDVAPARWRPYVRRKSLPSNHIPDLPPNVDFKLPRPPTDARNCMSPMRRRRKPRRRSLFGESGLVNPLELNYHTSGSESDQEWNAPSPFHVAPIPGRKRSFAGAASFQAEGATASSSHPLQRRSSFDLVSKRLGASGDRLHLITGADVMVQAATSNLAITRQNIPLSPVGISGVTPCTPPLHDNPMVSDLFKFRQMHGIPCEKEHNDTEEEDDAFENNEDNKDENMDDGNGIILDVETEQVIEVLQEKIENEMTRFNCSDDEDENNKTGDAVAMDVDESKDDDTETVLPPRTPEAEIVHEFSEEGTPKEHVKGDKSYEPRYCWCTRCQMMYRMYKQGDDKLDNWGKYPCHKF